MSLNVKVKDQRSRSPGQKNPLCTQNTPAVWTEWNALVADNVEQAAEATIRSLRGGDRDFADLRALGLAGYRWALPRISSLRKYSATNLCDGAEMANFGEFLRPVFSASGVRRHAAHFRPAF